MLPCAKQHWECVGTNIQCCRLWDNKLLYIHVFRNCCRLSLAAVPAANACKCFLIAAWTTEEIRMDWPPLHYINGPFGETEAAQFLSRCSSVLEQCP